MPLALNMTKYFALEIMKISLKEYIRKYGSFELRVHLTVLTFKLQTRNFDDRKYRVVEVLKVFEIQTKS